MVTSKLLLLTFGDVTIAAIYSGVLVPQPGVRKAFAFRQKTS